jgi:hypothetical protein
MSACPTWDIFSDEILMMRLNVSYILLPSVLKCPKEPNKSADKYIAKEDYTQHY